MSRKAEASAMGMAERAEGAAGRKKKAGPVVYCGPTVRGVAKQYTVFSGGIPEALEDFSERHPEVKALLVPVEQFAENQEEDGDCRERQKPSCTTKSNLSCKEETIWLTSMAYIPARWKPA